MIAKPPRRLLLATPLLLWMVLGPLPARAEEPAAPAAAATLDGAMARYYEGEKAEGVAWLAVGGASLVIGSTLILQDNRVMRGASYPALAVGVIQFIAGVSSLARSDARLEALRHDALNGQAAVRNRESKRIGRVNSLMKIVKYTEYSLAGVGAIGAAVGGSLKQDQILGAGVGLMVECALMLTLDHFAEERALGYFEALRNVSVSVVPRPEGTALMLGFASRF